MLQAVLDLELSSLPSPVVPPTRTSFLTATGPDMQLLDCEGENTVGGLGPYSSSRFSLLISGVSELLSFGNTRFLLIESVRVALVRKFMRCVLLLLSVGRLY